MATDRLFVEVWMRKSKGSYQFRGLVRRGTDYLYRGEWLRTQQQAAADADRMADRIDKKEHRRVIH